MSSFRLNALSRATRLWVASLGTAVLLPLSGLALAAEGSATPAPLLGEKLVSGHFVNLQALNANPTQRSVGEVGTDLLLQETGMRIRSLIPQQSESFKDLKVMTGQLEGRARALSAPGEMTLVSRPDGRFIALLPDADAIIRGDANGQQTLIRLDTRQAHLPGTPDFLPDDGDEVPNLLQSRNGQQSYQVDRNAQGEVVIDLLAGFSQAAVDYIGDHEAYAMAQVASVNRALKQSKVQSVKLRLVGTQVIADDHPIHIDSLRKVSTLFADGMRQYSPDLVAGFLLGSREANGNVLGMAYVGGRYSVNVIHSATTFRHEIAHNIGGSHCPDGNAYRFGYHNGRVGTILCGNQVGYYSNPDVKDNQGVPLGDARTANMARLWRENAAKVSAYSPSVVPHVDQEMSSILDQRLDLARNEIRYFPLDVAPGTQRLVFSVTHGERYERAGKVQLLLKRGAKPTLDDYDLSSAEGFGTALAADNPEAGRWYLAIRVEKNKSATDQILEGHAFAAKDETTQARYLRLLATSSVDGKNAASAAELLLADARGKSLPRDSWRIHSTSSAASSNTAGSSAIDGNTASYWSSAADARYPHELIIDLGANSRFSHLHYLPRQDQGMSGNIKGYQIYAGDTPSGHWNLLAEGEFSAGNQVQAAALQPKVDSLPPVAVINGKSQANAGDKIVLDASQSSDPQGHALSFAWEVSPNLDFIYDGAKVSFTAPELKNDTRYRFTLTLGNGKHSSTQSHEVLVKAKVLASQCQPQWLKTTSYTENQKVQHQGVLYQARWWSQGHEPGNPQFTGADGSGKVWRDLGPCKGGVEQPDPPPVVMPPIASISGASQAKAGESVTLDAAGSSDPAGLALSYNWSVTPSVAFQASGSKLTFVAPKSDKDVSYRFTLKLSNSHHSVNRNHSVKVLASSPEQPVACQAPWSAGGTYLSGDKVSHKGRFYVARWWTSGNEPSAATVGAEGSGKVWRDAGPCN